MTAFRSEEINLEGSKAIPAPPGIAERGLLVVKHTSARVNPVRVGAGGVF